MLDSPTHSLASIQEPTEKPSLKFMLGVGALLLVGGFLYFKFRRQHHDEQQIEALRKKIRLAFPLAQKNLFSLVADKEKTVKDQNLEMLLQLAVSLARKDRVAAVQTRDPFLPPFEEGLFIADLPPAHRLLYNKYYFYKDHLLVVTLKHEDQTAPLTRADFKQAALATLALRGTFFFNCGPESGFSQRHKHIQILPEEASKLPILEKILLAVRDMSLEKVMHKGSPIYMFGGYEFLHGIIPIKSFPSLDQMAFQYLEAYKLLHECLATDILKNPDVSYNLIGTPSFLLMIPRKREKLLDKIGINAVGFMGSILLKDEVDYDRLEYLMKPTNILRELTFTDVI